MTEKIKISESELKESTELRDKIADLLSEVGQISLARFLLEKEVNSIREQEVKMLNSYETLAKQENDLVTKLLNKYGAGSLDLSTGELTPEK